VLGLWSIAGPWPFPETLPLAWSAAAWQSAAASLFAPLVGTVELGLAASGMATLLVILVLAGQDGARPPGPVALLVLYAPLVVPEMAFLFGFAVAMIGTGLDGSFAALLVAHLVFVCPYVYLSLAGPWRAMDSRLPLIASTLGAGPWRVLLRIRLPVMATPILTATALGFAVSVALYLPTRIIGAGRFSTVTTEAVALAASQDRRLIGATVMVQALLPAVGFTLALAGAGLLVRNRRALAAGSAG
jgi:putative thiamine transport system permease protein